MTDNEIKKLASSIKKIIGNSVTEDEILHELEKYIVVYKIPVENAKQQIIKKYGGRLKISDISHKQKDINLVCKVVSLNKKTIPRGEKQQDIFYGLLGDETGVKPFTAWQDFGIEQGDVIEIENANVTEWQDYTQINLGKGTKIKKTDAGLISFVDYNTNKKIKNCKITELQEGMRCIGIETKILSISKRDINVHGVTKTVYSGILGDETGVIRFSAWYDFGLEKNKTYRIEGGYIKKWQNELRYSFDERDKVIPLDKSIKVKYRDTEISELSEMTNRIGISIRGTILEIYPGTGVLHRCEICKRVLSEDDKCNIHGTVKGYYDMRVKCAVDDGTGVVRAIMNKECTEKILNKKLDEYLNLDENMDETILGDMKKNILLKPYELHGYVIEDDYGMNFICDDVEQIVFDKEKVEKLLREIT